MKNSSARFFTPGPALGLLALTLNLTPALAASHTWSGNGANAFWSTAANWVSNDPPVANETSVGLIFPSGALQRISTNDVAGLQASSIIFNSASPYTLRGKGTGTNITLLPGGAFGTVAVFTGTGHALEAPFNFTLTGTNGVRIANGGSLHIAAALTGAGSLAVTDPGLLILRPVTANTFAGTTFVDGGTVEVHGTGNAIPGPLFIGVTNGTASAIVRLMADNQIANAAPVTIHTNGQLQVNGFDETIGPLTLISGSVTTGSGILEASNITALPAASVFSAGSIAGNLRLPAAATNSFTISGPISSSLTVSAQIIAGGGNIPANIIEKLGPASLQLSASNSFNRAVIVREGTLIINNDWALGGTTGGTTVSTNATLWLTADLGNESLTLEAGGRLLVQNQDASSSGPIILAGDAIIGVGTSTTMNGNTFTLSGNISGPGGYIKTGRDTFWLANLSPNTYAGTTFIREGLVKLAGASPGIPGPVYVGGDQTLFDAKVQVFAPGPFPASTILGVNKHGTVDFQNYNQTVAGLTMNNGQILGGAFSTLTVSGPILCTNTAGPSTIAAKLSLAASATNIFILQNTLELAGALSGVPGMNVLKSGAGMLAFSGGGTLSGTISVANGSVNILSPLLSLDFDLLGGAIPVLVGSNQIHSLTMHGGDLEPTFGTNAMAMQQFKCLAPCFTEFNLRTDTAYGHLTCAVAPQLGSNTAFSVIGQNGYNPAVGQVFTLIRNDSAQAVSGTFSNVPEAAIFSPGLSQYYRISYVGGDGNDVTATRVATPSVDLQSVAQLAGGKIRVTATGTPGAPYTLQATPTLGPSPAWQNIGQVYPQPDGKITLDDTNASLYPSRYYRFRLY